MAAQFARTSAEPQLTARSSPSALLHSDGRISQVSFIRRATADSTGMRWGRALDRKSGGTAAHADTTGRRTPPPERAAEDAPRVADVGPTQRQDVAGPKCRPDARLPPDDPSLPESSTRSTTEISTPRRSRPIPTASCGGSARTAALNGSGRPTRAVKQDAARRVVADEGRTAGNSCGRRRLICGLARAQPRSPREACFR